MGLYAAFDLHSNNSYLGIIDENGQRVFTRKLRNDITYGPGMEPKVFWSANSGKGLPVVKLYGMTLILMGVWCSKG